MQSRPLAAADLGLAEDAVDRLAGRVMIRGRRMTVRVEILRIVGAARGRQSLSAVINKLIATARDGGMKTLVLEGVSVGNPRLARILVERYGAVFTPQRTLLVTIPL